MNDPIVDLQPILSSDDEEEIMTPEINRSSSVTVQKTHSLK